MASGGGRDGIYSVKFSEQPVEMGSGVFPLKRLGVVFVVPLEATESIGDGCCRRIVVGCQNFSLDDGEVDLDLIEPAGMDRTVNQAQVSIAFLQALDAPVAAVGT